MKPEAYKPETTDLKDISRAPDRCQTIVTLVLDWDTKLRWLVLGESRIRTQRDRPDGRWRLEAYLKAGVTDFEHDSAYALRLPLIGVHFEGVEYHQTRLTAWVDPNEADDFHVPKPGYNPMKHPKIHVCKGEHCTRDDPSGHIIVPEGLYVPPFEADLYRAVRGKQVEILISPVRKDEE